MGADPAASFFVGDSETDVAAARSAGLPVVCVAFGYAHGAIADLKADWVIDSFDDPGLLDEIGGRRLTSCSPDRCLPG